MTNVLNEDGDEAPGLKGDCVGWQDEARAGRDLELPKTSAGVHKDKRFLQDIRLFSSFQFNVLKQMIEFWCSEKSTSFVVSVQIWQIRFALCKTKGK